jgi:Tfp pilus assembly protein PilV
MKRWNSLRRGLRPFCQADSYAGFSTTEALISAAITAVGTLGVAGLFIMGTRMQSIARYGSGATGLATERLERLRMLPATALERQNGGNLTADVANHFAIQDTYRVRWVIADGPAGTKDITVRAIHNGGAGATGSMARTAEVRTLLWR